MARFDVSRPRIGIEFDRLVIVGNRMVVLAFASIRVAPIEERGRIFPVELDCLRKVGDGAIGLALPCVGDAPVFVGDGAVSLPLLLAFSYDLGATTYLPVKVLRLNAVVVTAGGP